MVRRDKFSKEKRSLIMSKIRSKNTKLDRAMQSLLRKARVRFKMYPKVLGNPDFLVGEKITIFCDSSFWHGRDWNRLRKQLEQGSNPSYWVEHIAKNRKRDRYVSRHLKQLGYGVIRFWDSDILENPDACIAKVRRSLKSRELKDGKRR